jgi:hypothetical protein
MISAFAAVRSLSNRALRATDGEGDAAEYPGKRLKRVDKRTPFLANHAAACPTSSDQDYLGRFVHAVLD